ncbi:MFS transporter [Niveispirillum sp. KHB5.9]|uniref:MFS transporter n=1 Tax=Niveispirillum sp. KHB5.9 TaxID=3400269 RepID=UPI003A87B13E
MQKPRLSLIQIWNMSIGFLGIQVAFGLQNANASRIFQTLGADINELAILWVAAPLTGLLVQPVIGHLSDKTWGRLGRRRPYFLLGAILVTCSLLIMPSSPALWFAASMLWILDASINITMEPFRAFVGDLLPDEQRMSGFAAQSFFIGVGAVGASALPWMLTHWFGMDNTAAPGMVPLTVHIAFYVGAAAILLTVLWTVLTTREYSPDQMAAFEAARLARRGVDAVTRIDRPAGTFQRWGLLSALIGLAVTLAVGAAGLEKEVYILGAGLIAFGAALLVHAGLKAAGKGDNGFSEVMEDLFAMPPVMRRLALVQFFSWFALFAMWIYTTSAVTGFHYQTSDTGSQAYNDGADWVGLLFAVYNGVAAIAAFLLPAIARLLGRRGAHMVCLGLGGAGLISFPLISDPSLLWLPMIGVGFAWSSILSAPYSILSAAVPAAKMGVYMGIFNIFIVVPQVLAASILGAVLRAGFGGEAIWALVLGGGAMILAALSMLAVRDES